MDITYDLIIKYLVKDRKHPFLLNKGETSEQVRESIKKIYPTIYRYGVPKEDSFWYSILTLLDKNFTIPYEVDEITLINNFKNELIEKYKKQKLSKFLRVFDKADIRERFKIEPDINIFQYIADILDINIIIFDCKSENIYSIYYLININPNRDTIFLANYDKYYQPLMTSETKIFKNISELLKEKIEYYQGDIINKVHTFNKEEVKYNKTLLNKLKVDELRDIINKYEIDIDITKPKKADLINIILESLSMDSS